MARKRAYSAQQDPAPRKGVKKNCEECQKLYKAVSYSRWVRVNRNMLTKNGSMVWEEIALISRQEPQQLASLKAHVATHLIPTP